MVDDQRKPVPVGKSAGAFNGEAGNETVRSQSL